MHSLWHVRRFILWLAYQKEDCCRSPVQLLSSDRKWYTQKQYVEPAAGEQVKAGLDVFLGIPPSRCSTTTVPRTLGREQGFG